MFTVSQMLLWLAMAALVAAVFIVGYLILLTRRIAAEAERAVPATGRFLELGKHRIHYVEQGQGRPILFIHGLGGQLHHFRHTLFAHLADDFRLVALDRPGSGYSARPADFEGSLTEQAEVIARFIEALGLQRPLIVGHSFGGAVALALALAHPQAISGLVLLSPLTHLEDNLRPEFRSLYVRSPLLRQVLAQTVWVPATLKFAQRTLAFVFGPQEPTEDFATGAGGLAGLRPCHIYATSADLVAIERDLGHIEARYEEIVLPVGLLFGTSDRVLDHGIHGKPLAGRIRNFDMELVDGLGHMPQFIEPGRVEAMIRRIAEKAFATPAGADRA